MGLEKAGSLSLLLLFLLKRLTRLSRKNYSYLPGRFCKTFLQIIHQFDLVNVNNCYGTYMYCYETGLGRINSFY